MRILRRSSQQVVIRVTLRETGAQEQESKEFVAFPEWSSDEIHLLGSSRGLEFIKHKGVNPEDFVSWLAATESTCSYWAAGGAGERRLLKTGSVWNRRGKLAS